MAATRREGLRSRNNVGGMGGLRELGETLVAVAACDLRSVLGLAGIRLKHFASYFTFVLLYVYEVLDTQTCSYLLHWIKRWLQAGLRPRLANSYIYNDSTGTQVAKLQSFTDTQIGPRNRSRGRRAD
jgi:hypothetical protein